MARPVKIISATVVREALENAPADPNGVRSVSFVLHDSDHVLVETYTTTRQPGRYHEGPATIRFDRYPDGGIDVVIHPTTRAGV